MIVLIVGTLLFFNSPIWHKIGSKIKTAETKVVQETDSVSLPVNQLLSALPDTKKEVRSLTGDTETEVEKPVAEMDTTVEKTVVFDTTIIENSKIKLTIAGDGARIISAVMKGFPYAEKLNFGAGAEVELVSAADKGIAGTAIQGKSLNKAAFKLVSKENGRYSFKAVYGGSDIVKTFTLTEDSYVVGYEVQSEKLVGNTSTILFASGITESETRDGRGLKYSPRQIALYNGKKVEKIQFKKEDQRRESGQYDWVALTSRYFTMVALPSVQQASDLDMLSNMIVYSGKVKPDNLSYSFALTSSVVGDKVNYDLYLGPTQIKELKSLEAGLEKTVFRGYAWFFGANIWFPKLCELVLWLINLFAGWFRDFGIAIILITVLLRLVTYPLTNSSMKSMSKMKDMQPKLKEIQDKYKNNPQLLQAKMMEFYKEEGVNPLSGLGGCLPMFLQMPIMISLFVVLRKAVELRGQDTFLLPWVNDLSQKEALFDLPFTIPLVNIDTFALLPFAMAILMFFQNKMTMKGNSQDPNQRMMIYMMPLMMFFMFYNMPAGLTLYFTFSSVIQIVQQYFVDRKKSSVSVVK